MAGEGAYPPTAPVGYPPRGSRRGTPDHGTRSASWHSQQQSPPVGLQAHAPSERWKSAVQASAIPVPTYRGRSPGRAIGTQRLHAARRRLSAALSGGDGQVWSSVPLPAPAAYSQPRGVFFRLVAVGETAEAKPQLKSWEWHNRRPAWAPSPSAIDLTPWTWRSLIGCATLPVPTSRRAT